MIEFLNNSEWVSAGFGALIAAFLMSIFSSVIRKRLPIAHSIAVIGFPQSGKTTLITSIFSEIFARRIPNVSLSPRGEETINKINEDIACLDRGEKIGSTTDQDLFAYRAEMVTGTSVFSRRYKIEIGDFPGEDSEKFSNYDIKWLQNLPYFKWVMEADAFMFIIDVSKATDKNSNLDYQSQVISAYRASWQRLKDHHYDGVRTLQRKPVVLVFTKCDVALSRELNCDSRNVIEIDSLSSIKEFDSLTADYADLINFFRHETSKFEVVFSSSFAKNKSDKVRFGVKGILKGILP